MSENQNVWRKCGSCKKDIRFGAIYQKCSVSSCHKLAFCSVDCWDLHVPVMNHKSAWAEENRAPLNDDHQESTSDVSSAKRRIIVSSGNRTNEQHNLSEAENEILIVASKLKSYVKDQHELNTSAEVMEILSHLVRRLTDRASDVAKSQGRKTLMARDFDNRIN